MDFRIADTFTDSLVRLNGDEQKAVNAIAFDLPSNPPTYWDIPQSFHLAEP